MGENEIEIIEVKEDTQLDPKIDQTRIQVILPNGTRKVISISAQANVSELYKRVRDE